MVRAKGEADLFELAQAAGKEGVSPSKEGIPEFRILPGSESRGINQDGDDPGFETRVKPPTNRSSAKADTAKSGTEKKTPGRPRGSAQERTLSDIADTLEEKFTVIFTLLAVPLPVTGTYGVENAPKAVRALLSIAKRRPLVMKALMTVADGADGLEIGAFAAGLAVAVQVDMQRIQPDSLPARATGVTAVVEKYFMEEPPVQNPGMTKQESNAARFQPIP